MEDRSNKNIMISVLFLDIVGYSKEAVSVQISLKDRFNAFLSDAIRDMPVIDRVILDTGDGAAVNFMGDVEHALTAALRLRQSLLDQDVNEKPELLVRIGINLGPVRLVRDINGQPNIVGDGINVAQRVMGFAYPSQILVSRSYYDAVSRTSPENEGMFHNQGFRTDKHVREHEIYAIGNPGDQTTRRMSTGDGAEKSWNIIDGIRQSAALFFANMGNTKRDLSVKIAQADTRQRIFYAAVVAVPMLIGVLAFYKAQNYPEIHWVKKGDRVTAPAVETMQAVEQAKPDVVPVDGPAPAIAENRQRPPQAVSKAVSVVKSADSKTVARKQTPSRSSEQSQEQRNPAQSKTPVASAGKSEPVIVEAEATILINCKDGTEVYVDSSRRGVTSNGLLAVTAKPGKHKLIVNHPSFGVYSDELDLDAGKTLRVKPKVCQ